MYLYKNMKRDELIRLINDISPELADKIEEIIENDVEAAMDSWGDQEAFELSCHKESIETMEYLCNDPDWVRDGDRNFYYINGIFMPYHPDNHNISVSKFNETNSWYVEICCGTVGQDGWKGYLKGNLEDVMSEVVDIAKDFLKEGKYLKWNG